MKRYILERVLKSIVSIFAVVSIVIVMLYTMIPSNKVFDNDPAYKKMSGDTKTIYSNQTLDTLKYQHFARVGEICEYSFEKGSAEFANCTTDNSSKEQKTAIENMANNGFEMSTLKSGEPYGVHTYNAFELLTHFYSSFLVLDTKNSIQDENNPNLERKYYFGKNPYNGTPALMCSGCNYKYQIYFNGSFPFIHSNILTFNFGTSYPSNKGIPTLTVINRGQGATKETEQTFPTGATLKSSLIQTSCKYKAKTDHLDANRFDDNYANCENAYESPSMVMTSYIIGVISLIIAYVLAIPAGIAMAQYKDKLIDKIGIVYINLLVAIPSLAFIFFMRSVGNKFGLPDKFPQLGFNDIRSYIMPVVILALMSTPGLMMWLRRYMIDQSSQDYVKFARAKGLSQTEIFNKHILKNAIIPIVNGIPGSIILSISGALITESAFAVPGMGKMLPDAIKVVNNNMVITLVFIFTTLSILSVLAGDLLMTVVDPRIQLVSKGGND